MAEQPLLDVNGLVVGFPGRAGLLRRAGAAVRAVDGVSFSVARGETLGLVGESGCGKTTLGRAVLRLLPHVGATVEGRVLFEGVDVLTASRRRLAGLRQHMQIVFQDPGSSLNPRLRVGEAIAEPLIAHGLARAGDELRARVESLLERCGMPRSAAGRYPHEFSGGQRQRIAIARALALQPRLIVCDEPTSALDVSIQAQIINLLLDLQREFGMSYLFISHDMGVVQQVCARIAVMSAGRIVEIGTREQVLGAPSHAYTRKLLSAVPTVNVGGRAARA